MGKAASVAGVDVGLVKRFREERAALLGHLGGNRLVACLTVSCRPSTHEDQSGLRTSPATASRTR